ncbi:MAG: carbohydrate kinase family protein [Terracidiphilus sp.]
MKKYDIAVVGEIYVDHVLTGFVKWPKPGEEVFTNAYVKELGGGAAITACALARLGRSVSLIGVVGTNEMTWVEQRLSYFGVSSAGLRRGGGSTGVTVSVSSKVDRSYFTYVGENVRLEEQLAGDSIVEQLAEARHVHIAMPITASLADRLISRLGSRQCTTSLDVGHQEAWLHNPDNLKTCSMVNYLLPNEREAMMISAGNAKAYLDFTRSHHWPSGVVKMGASGAMMRAESGTLCMRSPKVDTIDTTGAGDAFDAGFIDGLLDDEVGEECLRRGCICGALSTRVAGALRGLPTRDELRRCYKETYG